MLLLCSRNSGATTFLQWKLASLYSYVAMHAHLLHTVAPLMGQYVRHTISVICILLNNTIMWSLSVTNLCYICSYKIMCSFMYIIYIYICTYMDLYNDCMCYVALGNTIMCCLPT